MRDIEQRHAIEFDSYFAHELSELNALMEDGLLAQHADVLQVTERGRPLLRTIAMVFDAYLPRTSSAQYSKVI